MHSQVKKTRNNKNKKKSMASMSQNVLCNAAFKNSICYVFSLERQELSVVLKKQMREVSILLYIICVK